MKIKTPLMLALTTLAVSYVVFALAATEPRRDIEIPNDVRLLVAPSIQPMPPPLEPFDETPITPVESTGAPMWS